MKNKTINEPIKIQEILKTDEELEEFASWAKKVKKEIEKNKDKHNTYLTEEFVKNSLEPSWKKVSKVNRQKFKTWSVKAYFYRS